MRRLVAFTSLLLAACAGSPTPAPQPREPIRLAVVGTNDFHGWLEPHDERSPAGAVVPVGGIDVFAGYLRVLREQGPVLLLDAGDMWQGTLASNLSEGAAVVEAYNALGYDAAAIGNHEFDFGPPGDAMVARNPGEDPLGALKARASQAKFPLLAANLVDRATGEVPAWVRPSVLIERGGVRIGVVGMATPDTPQVTIGANVRSVRFTDPLVAAIAEGRRLRKAGADVLVLLAHIGGTCVEGGGCEGELPDLVRRLPPRLYDAAIGGHTHRVVQTVVNGVPIIESGALGKAFGTIDLTIDPVTHRVEATAARAGIEVCARQVAGTDRCDPNGGAHGELVAASFRGTAVAPDSAIAGIVQPHLDRVAQVRARRLGAVLPATLRLDYDGESDVGNLVADAMRAAVPEATLAITNSGGLRAELPEGEVTFGEVFETLPFNNALSLVRVKGHMLRELVRAGFAGVHGGLQVSSNVQVVVDLDAPRACATEDLDGDGTVTPLDRDRVASLWVDGNPVRDDADYVLVTNDFLAGGGGGWDRVIARLPGGSVADVAGGPLQRDAFARWLEGRGRVVVPAKGRIELRGKAPACPPGR